MSATTMERPQPRQTTPGQPHTGLMLIGGKLVESADGSWLESIDPATEEYIGRVPRAKKADVDRAVAAALDAQPGWAALSVAQRGKYLLDLADALTAQSERILQIEVADTGNTISPMRSDLSNGLDRLKFSSGLATK